MKLNDENVTDGMWSKGESTTGSAVARPTEQEACPETSQAQAHTSEENACVEGPMALGKGSNYPENCKGYPPEVLRLLDVIYEVILESTSVNESLSE